jgi:hypothetical protein
MSEAKMIAWATTDKRLGGDPGITVTYYSGDSGITQEHDLPVSDLDRETLGDEYGRLYLPLADRLLAANGYEREEDWASSGGQWGARVSLREPEAEPHCNHDPAAVRDGICECGEIAGPCTECGDPASTEINAEALCSACADEYELQGSHDALDQIAALLDATAWDAGTASAIAEIVRSTGRKVRDTAEPDDITCGEADETGEDG